MVFKCQEDSFLKKFTSNVVSCTKTQINVGDISKLEGYEVILEDTILFPEGGGQPSDQGFLNDKPVHQVIRRGDKAVHLCTDPFETGDTVEQTVNWGRRFDHMQQHSGQHLITAIIDQEFGHLTVSWWLGEEISHIELNTPTFSQGDVKKAEEKINELIRDGVKVSVEVYNKGDPLHDVRARGLPEDHEGDVRVITIEGVDSNMCCGTHVANLSQLQVVKLLHTEKSKRKDQILLYFLVGNRVLNRLERCINREQQLAVLLKGNPAEHPDLVDKIQKNLKVLNKNVQSIVKDLAALEVMKLKNAQPVPKYYTLHRKDVDVDFMSAFIKEMNSSEIFLFLSIGEEKGSGNIVLYGSEKAISELGNKICELLGGKGSGKGNRFQAKVTNLCNRSKVEDLLKDYFK